MLLSDKFFEAARDYLFLMARNYPTKSILKLVGNRYNLPANERVMLFRGLVIDSVAESRMNKQQQGFPAAVPVFVDGFNVCRTVGSYLTGNFVFEGMDGFFRDVSELHRKKLKWDILKRAVQLIIQWMKENKAGRIHFYFDRPISHSGRMVELCRDSLKENQMPGEAETVFSPDNCLIEVKSGLICTADSHIIDMGKVPVFDLAHAVLTKYFQAEVFSLKKQFKRHNGS